MKTISAAIQALLDADTQFPITVVEITLSDSGNTVLYLADQDVTIDAQAYQDYLMGPPRLTVDSRGGIDNITIELNNADWAFSAYDNAGYFDGARVHVAQYFAEDETFAVLEGPVTAFSGVVSSPDTSGSGVMVLTVLVDGRIGDGNIGRTITGRCLNVFRDANCGYTHSAVVATAGTYNAGNPDVPISGTAATGQLGPGALPMSPILGGLDAVNRIQITRGGVVIYGDSDIIFVNANLGLATGYTQSVRIVDGPGSFYEVTLQVGDKIEYVTCPRDSMFNCARRWEFAEADRQQDHFMGFDYLHRWDRPDLISAARYDDLPGRIIPILYGHRWIDPVLMVAHQDREPGDEAASWQTTQSGPFVFALISEGPVEDAIEDPAEDVELDGVLAKSDPAVFDVDMASEIRTKVGAPGQAVNDFAPRANRTAGRLNYDIPALPAFQHCAYTALDLPDNYELVASRPSPRIDTSGQRSPSKTQPGMGGVYRGASEYRVTLNKPALRIKAKGRTVYTWSFVGSTPTKSGARAYSTNWVWQLLDLLTSPYRVAPSDGWSAGIAEADLDLGSFIRWAGYADESITSYDAGGNEVTVDRYVSHLYATAADRSTAINALLSVGRASLVFREGRVGVVCDAPVGGKGTATAGTADTLTDARRTDPAGFPDVPSWPTGGPNGLLEGLKIKILSGTGAGQVRVIESNTRDQITVTVNWTTNPDATSQYAIYAVELNRDSIGNLRRVRPTPSFSLSNQVVVEFDAADYRGQQALVAILDTVEDENGETHVDKYGLNERRVRLDATTDWQQAIRHGWYELRRELDTNREFELSGVNVLALPLEVGDLVLCSHDVDGLSNEVLRVERIDGPSEGPYKITARLYREHIHVDYPTDEVDGLDISSTLVNPHGVPPHVSNITHTNEAENSADAPLLVFQCDLPQWPYAGWHVLWEVRFEDSSDVFGDWQVAGVSETRRFSFRAARLADYEFRATFVSHQGIRADASKEVGTATAGGADTLTDSTKLWKDDSFIGLTLRILAGTGAGQERIIESNTEDEITVSLGWGTQPDATSEYDIYAPSPTELVGLFDGVDGLPEIDQDGADFFLKPNRSSYSQSIKYLVTTDGSTKTATQVRTTGTVSTSDEINLSLGALSDGTVVKVFVLYYERNDGTGVESPLRTDTYTYSATGSRPEVVPRKTKPRGTNPFGKEAFDFGIVDDSNQVAFWWRTYTVGDTPPAWDPNTHRFTDDSGTPDPSGFAADPLHVYVEITVPAEGDPSEVLEYFAEDGDGNVSDGTLAAPVARPLFIDFGFVPSGQAKFIRDDATGEIRAQVDTSDGDTGAWRGHIVTNPAGSNGYVDPTFNDALATEYSGTWGAPGVNGGEEFGKHFTPTQQPGPGEELFGSFVFVGTLDTDDASQAASVQSEPVRVSMPYNADHRPVVKDDWVRSGTTATLTLTIADPFLAITAVEFNKREGAGSATGWVTSWDTASGTTTLTRVEAVSVPQGKDSEIQWRVTYEDAAGVSRTVEGSQSVSNWDESTRTHQLNLLAFEDAENNGIKLVDGAGATYVVANIVLGGPGLYSMQFEQPIGQILRNITIDLYNTTGDNSISFSWYYITTGGAITTLYSSLGHSGTTGWETLGGTNVDHTAGTGRYKLVLAFGSANDVDDHRVRNLILTFKKPTGQDTR